MAHQNHRLVEFHRRLRGIQHHLEPGPFVLFNVEPALARGAPAGLEGHSPHKAIARNRKAAGEGAIIIGAMLPARHLFTIGVFEYHRQRFVLEHLVIVFSPVHPETDAFVLNSLPRPVERAVSEEDRLRVRRRR